MWKEIKCVLPTNLLSLHCRYQTVLPCSALQPEFHGFSIRLAYCHWLSLEITCICSIRAFTNSSYNVLSFWHLSDNIPYDQTKLLTHGCASGFVCAFRQSNQRLLHWLPSRKNVGSMGSHTSTDQIMQLAAVSQSWVGDKQISVCLSALFPRINLPNQSRVMHWWSHAYI